MEPSPLSLSDAVRIVRLCGFGGIAVWSQSAQFTACLLSPPPFVEPDMLGSVGWFGTAETALDAVVRRAERAREYRYNETAPT